MRRDDRGSALARTLASHVRGKVATSKLGAVLVAEGAPTLARPAAKR